MKKLFFLVFTICCIQAASAQYNKRFSSGAGKQEGFHLMGEALYLGKYGWGDAVAIGYRFNNRVVLGAGGGYMSYDGEQFKGTAVPLFADVRMNLLSSKCSPYVALTGGVYFNSYTNSDRFTFVDRTVIRESKHKSVSGYYNVAAGLSVRCTDAFAVYAGAGYNNIVNSYAISAGIAVMF
jgi:opacity protein-like surface antigen